MHVGGVTKQVLPPDTGTHTLNHSPERIRRRGGERRELPLEDGLSDSGDGPGVVGTCLSTQQTGSPQGSGRELCACARAHTHTHKHVALPNLSPYFESPPSRKSIARQMGSSGPSLFLAPTGCVSGADSSKPGSDLDHLEVPHRRAL